MPRLTRGCLVPALPGAGGCRGSGGRRRSASGGWGARALSVSGWAGASLPPGAAHPWSAKFLRAQRRRGTSARCELRRAGPAPSRAASPGAPGARSRSCPYLRAGGARRGGRAGSHWPRRGEWWPWPGPCPLPWPWPSLRWAERCAASTDPAWSLVPRGAEDHWPYRCAAAGELRMEAVIHRAAAPPLPRLWQNAGINPSPLGAPRVTSCTQAGSGDGGHSRCCFSPSRGPACSPVLITPRAGDSPAPPAPGRGGGSARWGPHGRGGAAGC